MRTLAIFAIAGFIFGASAIWPANSANAACAKIRPTMPGEVYLMRGLADIFSLGLDVYGKELSKKGIENCVYNHSYWQSIVDDIIERADRGGISQPIVIIGHSLGAGVAPKMATLLGKRGIDVYYVVMMDPVEPTTVGANVWQVINYYLPKQKDNKVYPTAEFAGKIDNVNVAKFGGFDHFNIDENKELRQVLLNNVIELSNGRNDIED